MVQHEEKDKIQLQHEAKHSGLVTTFQGPFQPQLAELSCSNQVYWLPGHKLLILHCQDSDVNECSADHEYGKNRSCKPEIHICFRKLKVWSKQLPDFWQMHMDFHQCPCGLVGSRISISSIAVH